MKRDTLTPVSCVAVGVMYVDFVDIGLKASVTVTKTTRTAISNIVWLIVDGMTVLAKRIFDC
jgi:hypothetical protein